MSSQLLEPVCATPTLPNAVTRAMIAEAAYFRALERGFAPGRELEDWIAAETEINARIAREFWGIRATSRR